MSAKKRMSVKKLDLADHRRRLNATPEEERSFRWLIALAALALGAAFILAKA
jgi:hypothetical protein